MREKERLFYGLYTGFDYGDITNYNYRTLNSMSPSLDSFGLCMSPRYWLMIVSPFFPWCQDTNTFAPPWSHHLPTWPKVVAPMHGWFGRTMQSIILYTSGSAAPSEG